MLQECYNIITKRELLEQLRTLFGMPGYKAAPEFADWLICW